MKSMLQKCSIVISMLLISFITFAQTEEVRVHWLDGPDVKGGVMSNVSSNGRYAVGYIIEVHSYIWDRTTGEVTIIPRSDDGYCEAEDVSNNGVIAGIFANPNYMEGGKAIACAGIYKNGTWIELPGVPGVEITSFGKPYAKAISDDGTIVGGSVPTSGLRNSACTWTNGTLDPLFGGSNLSMLGGAAYAMSGDGKVLGGYLYDADDSKGAAVWNKSWTPDYKVLAEVGYVMGISSNGKYVVGESWDDVEVDGELETVIRAFVWTEDGGMVYLPSLNKDYPNTSVGSVSDDGTTIIGYAYKSLSERMPIIYKNGVVYELEAYLGEFYNYSNESGNLFFTPMSISASGKTICGWGQTEDGWRIPWIVTIGNEDLTAVNDVEESNINVWSNGRIINVEQLSNAITNVEVIDMAGRTIKQLEITDNRCSIEIAKSGVYVVKVGNVAKKIIIK